METDKIRVLMKVLEKGSLAAAAEELDYTASGVSRMIASLEEETGFPLLVKTSTLNLPFLYFSIFSLISGNSLLKFSL